MLWKERKDNDKIAVYKIALLGADRAKKQNIVPASTGFEHKPSRFVIYNSSANTAGPL